MVILELIHASSPDFRGRDVFIRFKTNAGPRSRSLVIHSNCSERRALAPAPDHSSFCPINCRW